MNRICLSISSVVALAASSVVCAGVDVKVTFHGPRTVHVVKAPDGAARAKSFAVKSVTKETAEADSEIVVTRGADGATYFDRHRRFDVPAANFGPVVDTVGCGDAFTAAFVASRLRGEGYREAMTNAAQLAGKVAAGLMRNS